MPESQPTVIEGQIERITFRSDETHFMIARFRVNESQSLVTVLGHFPEPRSGETLRLKGQWTTHARYGQQFKVTAFEVLLPAGVEEIRRYLSSGLIKGIGPKTTERLIAHFKQETLAVIESAPDRLAEVKGIGPQKARRMGQAWQEHHAVRALMRFLQDHDIKPAYGARIYKTYGVEALDILRDNPYRVAEDLPRIGFYIADAIVRQSRGPVNETERARACVRHLLQEARDEGHMFVPRAELEERCNAVFHLDFHAILEALDHLVQEGQAVMDLEAPDCPVYMQSLYAAETEIASRLQALLTIPMNASHVDDHQIMATVVKRLAIRLSETQLAVLQSTLEQRVVIITGGPGT
ncbi:MAG: ATP-dependent RecD-like DNA helicase, partial [Desulfobacterales bacterium]|nr:ATP-dependent RecD-like DNA helicase [Desulfobacterales bacterium]